MCGHGYGCGCRCTYINVHVLKAGHPRCLSHCIYVYVFVLFECVVLGLGFLSFLPPQLLCHTQCIFMYLWIVGGYVYMLGAHAYAQRSVSPI